MPAPGTFLDRLNPRHVYNAHGTPAVPFGAVLLTGGSHGDDGAFDVTRPDSDSIEPARLLFNGDIEIPSNSYGWANRDYPGFAAVAGAVAAGDTLGTKANQWELDAAATGFVANAAAALGKALVSATGGGGGGGLEAIRIDSHFIRDTEPPKAAGTASPLCWYPGTKMKLTIAGWIPAPAPNLVWWQTWYTYGHIPPIAVGAPYTTVICNGTAAHWGQAAGFDYNPESNVVPAPPFNGEMRPVYKAVSYSAAVGVQCAPDPTTGIVTPVAILGG